MVNSLHAWDGRKSKRNPRMGRSFGGVKDRRATGGDVSGGLTGWGFSEQAQSKNVLVLRG